MKWVEEYAERIQVSENNEIGDCKGLYLGTHVT